MEEEEYTKHCLEEQGQSKEEKPDKQDDSNQTERVIPMLEAKQLLDNMTEERHENEAEVKVENRAMEEGRDGDGQTDSSKKLKQGSKHNLKAKVTIPQPFSLATEKRMSREKRGSMDLKDSKRTLAKSASLNYKFSAQWPKVSTNEHVDKNIENHLKTKDKVQVKEVERKKQVNAKKPEGDELESTKFQKSSTFKALPLPSFYHRKDSISAPVSKKKVLSGEKRKARGLKNILQRLCLQLKEEEEGTKRWRWSLLTP
ncbi:protein WVD2-like 7 isoform X2 [Cornus florida]|uniref:protein WVD2-like 7 isoform X2 n=1 Tax=Cornus florida TaxID=4283 RepID=UPI0028A1D5A7|nr:protein WVD2-like 7 isoform X2 [Cornus florida]